MRSESDMARPLHTHTPETRDRAQAWLRRATRATVLGAMGAATLIGVAVAQEHPGASSSTTSGGTGSTGSGSAGSSSSNSSGKSSGDSGTSGSSDTGSTGNTGSTSNTGSTGNTGNTGTSVTPSISRSTPAVTSGGTSR
jgi:hypothetical protein